MAVSSDSIVFEVDRLGADTSGHVVVVGRWYGVRGRRFVRPELIVHDGGGTEHRLLAELDEKPWAADDGEPWRATFPDDAAIDGAPALELSVAPDITVALRGTPAARRPPARTRQRPPIPLDAPYRRTRDGGAGSGAGAGADAGAGSAADAGRATGAGSAADAGTATGTVNATGHPEPDVDARAAVARAEAEAARLADRLSERLATAEATLARERERRADAEQALERQRGESRDLSAELGRVRAEVALAEAAEREARATSDLLDSSRREHHAARARYDALTAEHERALGVQARLRQELADRGAELDAVRATLEATREQLAAAGPGAGAAPLAETPSREARVHAEPASPAPVGPSAYSVHHSDRPLNPSLRSSRWPMRLLAVIVLAAIVIAVYLILHSTVLH